MTKRPLFLLCGAVGAIACGSLADPNTPTNLATIHGKLSGDLIETKSAGLHTTGATPRGPLRIAIVWRNAQRRGFNAAADVPVTAGATPFEFALTLSGAPPVDVLVTRSILASGNDVRRPDPTQDFPVPATKTPSSSGGSSSSSGSTPSSYRGLSLKDFDAEDLSADFAFAMGTLVAYRDNNNNGKLDLVDADASVFLDEVVGINSALGVFWFQGTIPNGRDLRDQTGTLPSAGYNIASLLTSCASTSTAGSSGIPESTENADFETPTPKASVPSEFARGLSLKVATPFESSCGRPAAWVSTSDPVEIEFSNDPRLAAFMCDRDNSDSSGSTAVSPTSNGSSSASSSSSSSSGGAGGRGGWSWYSSNKPGAFLYPSPTDPNLRCYDNGRSLSYNHCDEITSGTGLCRFPSTTCWSMGEGLADHVDAPTGWPCTVTSTTAPSSGGSSSSSSSSGSAGPTAVCITDQDCNADASVSSLWGTCNLDHTCTCKPGFVKNLVGKCIVDPTPLVDAGAAH